jgi:AsmA protein
VKALRYTVYGLAAALVLIGAGLAVVVATFDPNKYKPEIVRMVKDRTGRTLEMKGEIRLALYPSIGAAIGPATLSDGSGTVPFAAVESARISVKLLPLISRRIVVDQVVLHGLSADLVRYSDGHTNFEDLFGGTRNAVAPGPAPAPPAATESARSPAATEPAKPPAIDIGGIVLRDANLRWRDETRDTEIQIAGLNLKAGRIASGVPGKVALEATVQGNRPVMSLQIDAAAGYRFDFEKRVGRLAGLDVTVKGDAPGVAGLDASGRGDVDIDAPARGMSVSDVVLTAKSRDGLDARLSIPRLALAPDRAESKAVLGAVRLARPGNNVDAKVALSSLTMAGAEITFAELALDVDLRQADITVRGRLTTPVALNLREKSIAATELSGDFGIAGAGLPPKGVKLVLEGTAGADWGRETAAVAIAARLDESNVQARMDVTDFSPFAFSFDVNADRLDVDRYLPPKDRAANRKPATAAAAPAPAGAAPANAAGVDKRAEQPIDLAALKNLNASGTVRVGALTISHVDLARVNVGVKAARGRLDLDPIAANLYQGSLSGSARVVADDNAYTVRNRLENVSVGPLLRDLADVGLVDGRGNVTLDLGSRGTTADALKRNLAGNAAVVLRDGAVNGVNLAEIFRLVKAALGSRTAVEQLARGPDKTDFSDLSASFTIRNGVAHNEDLVARSPFFRVAGSGDIDLGAATVDYTARASIVDTAGGQGGKELGELRGVTVPVRVTGPFDRLALKVDVGALALDAATQEVTRRLEERVLGKPGNGGGLGDALRGLFGKKRQ